ncbi:hypothetical protein Lalb_Chr08g0237641 [Lupinus albus]|uniref:Uncharacterized protein n=1 Tax=Lupinus albus TaxID=3870 RepID=A0A6A4Q444_LUPAL|nr:hypothetical protein Lalb_Chr08g0237641 [Lupinus albus]
MRKMKKKMVTRMWRGDCKMEDFEELEFWVSCHTPIWRLTLMLIGG